jgi:hypothetical protein
MSKYNKKHLLLYLDFLGFSEFVEKIDNEQIGEEEVEKFVSSLESIKACNQEFNMSPEEIQGISSSEDIQKLTPLSTFFASDTLVLSWPLQDDLHKIDVCLFAHMCEFIMPIIHNALGLGLLVRGAITVGGYYHKHDIFFGKACLSAARLEKEEANYPRIFIDTEQDILKKLVEFSPSEAFEPFFCTFVKDPVDDRYY